jgi:hypothetical protein
MVSGASHPSVARDARPDRIQRAEPLVAAQCHNSTCDLVSHPNAKFSRRGRPPQPSCSAKAPWAAPVGCNA